MKKAILIILLFSDLIYPANNIASGEEEYFSSLKKKSKEYSKLSSGLIRVIDESDSKGALFALQNAVKAGIDVRHDRITVVVEVKKEGNSSRLEALIRSSGGEVISAYKDRIRIRIIPSGLRELNKSTDIKIIRLPFKPLLHRVIGEQVSLTGASLSHTKGITGTGIKIAIIDGGFKNYSLSI
ncbi:MAG: hypothetical protein KKH98_10780, partial [Spirochaetes bacterium]|nr:hypothetical protein [Spirochaetota bacterium]